MAEKIKKDSTPIVETNAQGLTITTFTQYQNKLLLRIIACKQQDIRDAITQQTNDKTYNPVFTAEENASGYRTVRIPLNKLEPRNGHRQRAKQALSEMPDKHIFIPIIKGNKMVDYVGFRTFLYVKFEYKAHQTIAVLFFPIIILRYYLSIDLGYHYLDPQQLRCFKHNSTRQMYRVYKSYFALGKNSFSPQRLAITLSPKDKFASYSAIKKEVFQVAKKEMDLLYQNGLCDIHFDFKMTETRNKIQNKEKQKVLFTFYTRQDDTLSESRKDELEAYQARIWFILKNEFGVNEHTARDLGQQVKIWMIAEMDELILHKMWFANKMETQGNKLFNKAGYIVNALKKFFREMNQKKDESEGIQSDSEETKGDGEGSMSNCTPPASPLDPNGQFYWNEND